MDTPTRLPAGYDLKGLVGLRCGESGLLAEKLGYVRRVWSYDKRHYLVAPPANSIAALSSKPAYDFRKPVELWTLTPSGTGWVEANRG